MIKTGSISMINAAEFINEGCLLIKACSLDH